MKVTLKKTLLSKNILFLESVKADQSSNYADMISNNCGILGAVLKSIGRLGYTFDKESILKIAAMDRNDLKKFYDETFDFLGATTGITFNMKTVLFPEFPKVDDLSAEDMFFRTMIHYFSSAISDLTGFEVAETTAPLHASDIPFNEKTVPTVLKLKTSADLPEVEQVLASYFKNSLGGTVAIPNVKKESLEDIYTYFALKNRYTEIIPDSIPFKENMVYLFGLLTKQYKTLGNIFERLLNHELKFNFLKTITDYLRLYTYLSSGKYMINSKTKYITLPRKGRRWFLRELNNLAKHSAKCAEFASYREEWIHVFENLHPGDYDTKYPYIYKAARDLREDKLSTFNAKIENAFYHKDTDKVIDLLSQRPGLFARSLDRIIRNDGIDTAKSLAAFGTVSDQIATNVIIQLYNYYLNRNNSTGSRTFLIKKEEATAVYQIEDNRNPAKNCDINLIHKILAQSLTDRQKTKLGLEIEGKKVWLDESMKRYAIPTNDRGVSENIKSVPFGSYYDITPDKDVIRLFTHWKNGSGRVDIDLSCMMMDSSFKEVAEFSWRSYTQYKGVGLAFSGDVTDAPKGANEYIDINYKQLREKMPDVKYIVITNNVYTGQNFADIPECFSGIMFREHLGGSGEVFEPSTVTTKFDLTQPSSCMNIAAVVDIENMRLYYVDQPLQHRYSVAGHFVSGLSSILRNAVSPKLTMYDLVKIAARSKQFKLTRKPETADYIISDDDASQLRPWDQELFVKMFM